MTQKLFLFAVFGCLLAILTVTAQGADADAGLTVKDVAASPEAMGEHDAKMARLRKHKEITDRFVRETHYEDAFFNSFWESFQELMKINGWEEDESLLGRFQTYYDANDNGRRDWGEFCWDDGYDAWDESDDEEKQCVPTANGKWCVDFIITDDETTDLTPLKNTNLGTILLGSKNIHKFPKITGLSPRGIALVQTSVSDLSPLKDLPSIESLKVIDNPKLEDFSPLAQLPHVKWLHLEKNKCHDYAPLLKAMNLSSLTTLCLSCPDKFDGALLQGADQLKSLRLFGAPLADLNFLAWKPLEVLQLPLAQGVDLSPLAKLPLKELVISGEGAAKLDFVKNFPQLAAFCVHHAPVRDLSPLAGLPLKELALEALPELADLGPVAALPQLRLLSLRETGVGDVSSLAKAAIVDLALCDNPKIATLPFIPSVKVLRLFKTKIKDAAAWDGKKLAVVYQDETFPSEKIVGARYDDENALKRYAAKLSGTNPLDLRIRARLAPFPPK